MTGQLEVSEQRFLHVVRRFEAPMMEVELTKGCSEAMGGCGAVEAPFQCRATADGGCDCAGDPLNGWNDGGVVQVGPAELDIPFPTFDLMPMRFCRTGDALRLRPFWKTTAESHASGDGLVFGLRRAP